MTGNKLREIYTKMGYSQPKMAELLGVSTVAFKRFATNERPVSPYIARLVIAAQLLQENNLLDSYVVLAEPEITRKRAARLITDEQRLAKIPKSQLTIAANAANAVKKL